MPINNLLSKQCYNKIYMEKLFWKMNKDIFISDNETICKYTLIDEWKNWNHSDELIYNWKISK